MLTLTAERDNIATAFDISYRYLSAGQQRLFRLVSLHPGSMIDPRTAAALGGITLDEAKTALDALHQEALLTEIGHRRYVLHDLIRRYALYRAGADPQAERARALDRLLDYYQQTTAVTEAILTRQVRPQPGPAAHAAAPPAATPEWPDRAAALRWARTEHDNVLACLDHVSGTGQHARVVSEEAWTLGVTAPRRRRSPGSVLAGRAGEQVA